MLNSRLSRALSWVLLACCFLGACFFLEHNIETQLDSDISSDLLHAGLVAEEGRLLSKNWYYSTELRVVHVYLLFAPLFHLFESWHTIRVVGSILWYVVLLLSALYACRQCRMQRVFPVMGALLMMPLCSPYYDNVLKGIYYVPYLSGSLIVLGLALQSMHTKTKGMMMLMLVLTGVLSIAFGMSGMRMILVLFLPMLLAALVNIWLQKKNKGAVDKAQIRFVYTAAVGAAGGLIGCGLNLTVLSKIYSFRSFTDLYFMEFSLDRVIEVLNDWLIFWGYRGGKAFSSVLVHNLFALILILILLYCIWRYLQKKDSCAEKRLLMLVYVIGMGLYTALVAVTTVPYHITYQLPVGIFGMLLVVSALETPLVSKRWQQAAAWLVIIGVIGCGALEYRAYAGQDHTADLRRIADQLVEEEYSAGYSSFWSGNILTELTDGRVDMYVWEDYGTEDVNEMYPWLQEKRHDTQTPQGRVCIVLEADAADRYPVYQWLSQEKMIYDGEHLVYGFESYDEMISHIEENKKR